MNSSIKSIKDSVNEIFDNTPSNIVSVQHEVQDDFTTNIKTKLDNLVRYKKYKDDFIAFAWRKCQNIN